MKPILVNHSSRSSGWTLVEVLMVVIILAILATMSLPMNSYFKKRGEQATCIGNLRALHNGTLGYLQDHEMMWPQPPVEFEEEHQEWKWWYETLKDYDVRREYWLCPADRMAKTQKKEEPEEFISTYVPTSFDNLPNTAFRWSSQPWFIERGQFHGDNQGSNVLMPDGSVRQELSMGGN